MLQSHLLPVTFRDRSASWDLWGAAEAFWGHRPQARRADEMTFYALKGRNERAWEDEE